MLLVGKTVQLGHTQSQELSNLFLHATEQTESGHVGFTTWSDALSVFDVWIHTLKSDCDTSHPVRCARVLDAEIRTVVVNTGAETPRQGVSKKSRGACCGACQFLAISECQKPFVHVKSPAGNSLLGEVRAGATVGNLSVAFTS